MSVTVVYHCDDCAASHRNDIAEAGALNTPKGWYVWLDGAVYLHACPGCAPARRNEAD